MDMYRDLNLKCPNLTALHLWLYQTVDNPSASWSPTPEKEREQRYWIESFQLFKRQFSPLYNISTLHLEGVFKYTLKMLLPSLPELRSLGISRQLYNDPLFACPDETLQIVSKGCSKLHRFHLQQFWKSYTHGGVISAKYLEAFARAFPELHTLILDLGSGAVGEIDLNDDDIDSVAQLLPDLQVFCLKTRTSKQTHRSLISLGKYCQQLQMCSLVCDFSYTKFTETTAVNLFPQLSKLQLCNTTTDPATVEVDMQTSTLFLKILPQLRDFELRDYKWGDYANLDDQDNIADEQDWFQRDLELRAIKTDGDRNYFSSIENICICRTVLSDYTFQ